MAMVAAGTILGGCERQSYDLGVGIPTIDGRDPLLPEYAARRGRPYAPLSTQASEVARRAVSDIIGEPDGHWVEDHGIEAVWIAKQRYCRSKGVARTLQVGRITPAVARTTFGGCKAQAPEPLGVNGRERFALVRLRCSPRFNGWYIVNKTFEVRVVIAIENDVELGVISFDVGDPSRIDAVPLKTERTCDRT